MGQTEETKVAGLRQRISKLKEQLEKTRGQREQWRKKHARDAARLGFYESHPLVALANAFAVDSEMTPVMLQFAEYLAAHGKPGFFDDGLACWYRTMDSLESPRFRRAYEAGMDSGHKIGRPKGSKHDIRIPWRVYMAVWAASHAARLPGDFVECGVNTGILSLAICHYLDFNSLDKDFYLFDTFRGIPEEQMSDKERKARMDENESIYEECYETTKSNFAPWTRCHLVRGMVPQTLTTVAISKVSYLHIDMNITAPERAALEFFWDKVVPGGVILLDDYGYASYPEQFKSANEFAASKGVSIATLPTGQGLLLKS